MRRIPFTLRFFQVNVYAEKGLDAAVEAATAEDDDIYDAVYYGGTLDAAYCYADR